jgi:trans-aconitate methyltransferase
MSADVHRVALKGFGNAAQTYARGRPDYPQELLGWLRSDIGLGPKTTAIDLGAGTGKFTRMLAQTGAKVIAVEPVDAMRAELAAAMPDVQAIPGTAQTMNVPGCSSLLLLHLCTTACVCAGIH